MPIVIRVRKDIIDPRPIRVYEGPKSYRYRWKMMALLDRNQEGEFVLPFSRRLAHIDRMLWPRSWGKTVPPDYEECGCISCENKTYTDHIFREDDDDNKSESGNYHLEQVYVESEDEKTDDGGDDINEEEHECETSKEDQYKNHIVSSTIPDDPNTNHASNHPIHNHHGDPSESISVTSSYSPFPCDPYESFDWEY